MHIEKNGQKVTLHTQLRHPKETAAQKACFIAATGTPLDKNEDLLEEGLERLLDRQWLSGIHGVLVAGTMGVMQLLRDSTYRTLVERSIAISNGRGEVLVGCGDTSLARTMEKIEYLNGLEVDGVVALSPYFMAFSQEELFSYYWSLADRSNHPLYIYEIPCRTGVALEHLTVERLAEHHNIRGIKCSCEWAWTEELIQRLGDRLRIIVVQLDHMDQLLEQGVMEHLDGIFSIIPSWTVELGKAVERGDRPQAAEYRRRIVHIQDLLRRFGSFQTATVLWNSQGIPGNFAPAPLQPLTEQQKKQLFDDPVIQLGPR